MSNFYSHALLGAFALALAGASSANSLTATHDGALPSSQTRGGTVLVDQPVNGTTGLVSTFLTQNGTGAKVAADFTLDDSFTITFLAAPGFLSPGSALLSGATSLTWEIFTSTGTTPNGDSFGGAPGPLVTVTLAPNAPGVSTVDDTIAVDLVAAGQTFDLPAGQYWLSVYPNFPAAALGAARWNWFQAAQVANESHLISPVTFGVASWTSFSGLGVTVFDSAFTIEGIPAGEPAVTITGPTLLDFGVVTTNTTSGELTTTITNSGDGEGDFTWSAAAAPFARSGGTCTGPVQTLAAGASCTLSYTYSPTAQVPSSQLIVVETDGSSASFELRGQGRNPAIPVPVNGLWALLLLIGGIAGFGVYSRRRLSA